jgi:hypothetical protein
VLELWVVDLAGVLPVQLVEQFLCNGPCMGGWARGQRSTEGGLFERRSAVWKTSRIHRSLCAEITHLKDRRLQHQVHFLEQILHLVFLKHPSLTLVNIIEECPEVLLLCDVFWVVAEDTNLEKHLCYSSERCE